MKKILKRTSLLLISALMSIAAAQAQKVTARHGSLHRRTDEEDDRGRENRTIEPTRHGRHHHGQAKSSDVAQKIEKGLVGGLFNLKRCRPYS